MNEKEDKQPAERAPKATRKQRALLVDFCRVWGQQMNTGDAETSVKPAAGDAPPERGVSSESLPGGLSPREGQTLELLLAGDSEKQIAVKMEISQHTVHGYVKALYKRFDVSTRAELLALWVKKR